MISIFKGFVVTLRVHPTAFYTPSFHVYNVYLYICVFPGRISQGVLVACLCTYVHVFHAELAVQNAVASPILVRLLCKYPSRIGGIPLSCQLLTLCPHLRLKFVVTLHFCPFLKKHPRFSCGTFNRICISFVGQRPDEVGFTIFDGTSYFVTVGLSNTVQLRLLGNFSVMLELLESLLCCLTRHFFFLLIFFFCPFRM